jgi:hypothetical protein
LLNGVLAAHDVHDLEGLAARVLDDQLGRWGAHLQPELHEDALAYLIAVAWECSEKYDPTRGLAFSTCAYRICRLKLVDWYREEFGTTRWKTRPLTLSLEVATGDGNRDLGEFVAAREGDPADRGDPALARLLKEAGSSRAQDLAELRRAAAA